MPGARNCDSFLLGKFWSNFTRSQSSAREATRSTVGRAFLSIGRLSLLALLAVALQCSGAFAQGFGVAKKTVFLKRRLPALVHLPGTGIDIRPDLHDQANADVAQALSQVLLATLQHNDTRLHEDKNSPDVLIPYSIITYETPPPTTSIRQETQYQNKHWVQVPVQYYKVTGELKISYRALDAHKKPLDADTITYKYSQEFQAGTNQATGGSASLAKFDPRNWRKKTDEDTGPPDPVKLRGKLLEGVVSQVAPRLVNTEELLEVMLSRGKAFDNANKLADKGQWTRYLETLETMTPLADKGDDAYRLYNIGVAYEALAYQAEDKVSIQKFLGEAGVKYGAAIDAKPSEKYFIEPQTRIETAVAHYKKLSEGANTIEATKIPSRPSGPVLDDPPTSKPENANANPTHSPTSNGPASPKVSGPKNPKPPALKPSGPPLTNADIIKMAKGRVDEDSIIAAIDDASNIDFDLSVDGLITLSQAGVTKKTLTAMRARAHARQAARRAASPGAN